MTPHFALSLALVIIFPAPLHGISFWNNKRTHQLNSGKCQCYVPFHGIFNGIELNKYRSEDNCEPHLYYCAKGNYCGDPVLLMNCFDNFGCFYQPDKIDCKCKQRYVGSKVCGSKLDSPQCFDDILYYCKSEQEPEVIGICEMFDYIEEPSKDKLNKVAEEL